MLLEPYGYRWFSRLWPGLFAQTIRHLKPRTVYWVASLPAPGANAETVAATTHGAKFLHCGRGLDALRNRQQRVSTCDRFELIGAGGFRFVMKRGSQIPVTAISPRRTAHDSLAGWLKALRIHSRATGG
jgi:hypothetical protein